MYLLSFSHIPLIFFHIICDGTIKLLTSAPFCDEQFHFSDLSSSNSRSLKYDSCYFRFLVKDVHYFFGQRMRSSQKLWAVISMRLVIKEVFPIIPQAPWNREVFAYQRCRCSEAVLAKTNLSNCVYLSDQTVEWKRYRSHMRNFKE